MGGLRVKELWRAAGGAAFALYLVAVAASLFRVADQPAAELSVGSTEASLVPSDLVFAALAVVVVAELVRGRVPGRAARGLLLAAAAFGTWLGLTALPNGGTVCWSSPCSRSRRSSSCAASSTSGSWSGPCSR